MIFAKKALLNNKWAQNVRIDVALGTIIDISENTTAMSDDVLVDTLLPSIGNLHSHSFQRAMAGMTEHRVQGRDSFWSWRDLMYRFLKYLTPEQIQAIAALTFMEMQEAGFASVGEFHYVHHQSTGKQYTNAAELSQRIFAAALETGIGLTHLPVLYTYGGAQKSPLSGGQLRFGNSLEQYEKLLGDIQIAVKPLPQDTNVGIAPHSLRATAPDELKALIAGHNTNPIHIHIAEQPKEVSDIQHWLGARPVEWLMNNVDVNERWCLIHATHMTDSETVSTAKSLATVGLCPITEANLGDGPFNGVTYLKAGGRFGIGSDSNVRISLTQECRQLEYSQRLRDLGRNILVDESGSTGQSIYTTAAKGGASALGRKCGTIKTGNLADLVAINSEATSLCSLDENKLLDGFCFASNDNVITDVWSAGRHSVKNGQHIAHDQITKNYKCAISQLIEQL